MATKNTLLGNVPIRRQITIPAASDVGTPLRTLLSTAGIPSIGSSIAFKILGTNPDASARAAFILGGPLPTIAAAGTDYSTHGQLVASGADYVNEPSDRDVDSIIRAASGAAFTAVIVVCF